MCPPDGLGWLAGRSGLRSELNQSTSVAPSITVAVSMADGRVDSALQAKVEITTLSNWLQSSNVLVPFFYQLQPKLRD